MWKRYNELLVTRPLITKCITSAVLYMAGDGAGQYLDGTLARVGYQPRRTVSAGIFGGLVFAPIAHGNSTILYMLLCLTFSSSHCHLCYCVHIMPSLMLSCVILQDGII